MKVTDKTNNQRPTYKKPNAGYIAGGIAAGYFANKVVGYTCNNKIAPIFLKKMLDSNKNIYGAQNDEIEKAIDEIISPQNEFYKKGVRIVPVGIDNESEIKKIVLDTINKKWVSKILPKKIRESNIDNLLKSVQNGGNAFYLYGNKTIFRPQNGLNLALFHEFGHAANDNFGIFGKIIAKCKFTHFLPLPIFCIALCKTKKAPNEKTKSKLYKTLTFIKENAAKLTFISFLPLLADEGLASIKGIRLAKQQKLSPELISKAKKIYKFGFLSYLTGIVLGSTLGVFTAVKIKDAIAKPVRIKKHKHH